VEDPDADVGNGADCGIRLG